MTVTKTKLDGVVIIEPKVFNDNRGYFFESYSKRDMEEEGLFYDFVQDNHSFSKGSGVFRGIHCQAGDSVQAKLVRCEVGAVIDFAVDLRKDSPTFKQWVSVELNEDNHRQFLIPRGFGHAFFTLTDEVMFLYKADNFYDYDADRSINYADAEIALDFDAYQSFGIDINNLILSDKDKNAPFLEDSDVAFFVKS
ncbi:MAG: dTDP-4-dehydrorhamnose 3,5-epimerase [Clostridiales Family XIII bacterium]|nr:dTDP-4-dehydrorhamnose 3,5-epimerase [Clostridiales Family XIII bacterium]